MENKKYIRIFLIVLVLAGFAYGANAVSKKNTIGSSSYSALSGQEMIVYKTKTCGCCDVYAKYMKREGVNVKVVDLSDLMEIKEKLGVPMDLQTCHTSVVGGYFIEGHIPLEVVEKLLAEKPYIKGIALPGMPSGSPGMPGPKNSDWKIYSVGNDGEVGEFMTY